MGEKNLKILASPEQTLPNHLSQSKSKTVETASIKSVTVASEDIIHSKLSTYEELDNMSRKDTGRNNKFKKIISKLNDIKFEPIIKTSGYDVPSQEKYRTSKIKGWEIAVIALAAILLGLAIWFVILLYPIIF